MSDFLAPYKLVSTSLVLTYQCSTEPFTYVCLYEFSVSDSLIYSNAWFGVYHSYGVATISRLLQIIGLFCKRAL